MLLKNRFFLAIVITATPFIGTIPAFGYGETATEIIKELSINHKARMSGTEKEKATAEYLTDLFDSYGLKVSEQPFSYELNGETFNSQNIIAEKAGTSGKQIILGAHYDTRPSSPSLDRSQLQGTNDNASGVGLIMELGEVINSIDTQHTIKFIAFGAEEVGLKGSAYHADNMSQTEINNTLFMANFDSIVFGDQMYFHAGKPAAERPEWGWVRDKALDIAKDLDIEVLTNPGLNSEYPKGTGCCSDQESFEEKMPVLVAEATNWFIGDLDGYTQTSNPIVPGGATWHDPVYDSLEFIEENFPGVIEERTENYSQIMQVLIKEVNEEVNPIPEPTTVIGTSLAVFLSGWWKRKNRQNKEVRSQKF